MFCVWLKPTAFWEVQKLWIALGEAVSNLSLSWAQCG
jgi:hypothetical protein